MSDDLEMERNRSFFTELFPLLNNNVDALKLAADLLYTAHLWDDLIDGDKVRTNEEINQSFEKMMARIPRNPFFQDHIKDLAPLMLSTILQWKDANKLESYGTKNERSMAYMLRNMLLQVIAYMIWLEGGDEWYEDAGVKFQRLCASGLDELYGVFWKEMGYA